MRLHFSALPFLVLCACGAAQASPGDSFKVGDSRRNELRDAVAAHRAAQREEVRREEAIAGRRLTAAELFELREQVRGQWTPPSAGPTIHSAESQPAERIVPAPTPLPELPDRSAFTAPRSQRR